MGAKFSLNIRPFEVPLDVELMMPAGRRQDCLKPSVRVRLQDLDEDTLHILVQEFALKVFEIAGRDVTPLVILQPSEPKSED